MALMASHTTGRSKDAVFALHLIGLLLLSATWIVLFETELWFTEGHLAGYYCCVASSNLPMQGTLARALSDFFAAAPGKYLPSLLFVGANAGIYLARSQHIAGRESLPLRLALFNCIYLIMDTILVGVSWSISAWLTGPVMTVYKGYHHTWPGIAAHILLWVAFYMALARASRTKAPASCV